MIFRERLADFLCPMASVTLAVFNFFVGSLGDWWSATRRSNLNSAGLLFLGIGAVRKVSTNCTDSVVCHSSKIKYA